MSNEWKAAFGNRAGDDRTNRCILLRGGRARILSAAKKIQRFSLEKMQRISRSCGKTRSKGVKAQGKGMMCEKDSGRGGGGRGKRGRRGGEGETKGDDQFFIHYKKTRTAIFTASFN